MRSFGLPIPPGRADVFGVVRERKIENVILEVRIRVGVIRPTDMFPSVVPVGPCIFAATDLLILGSWDNVNLGFKIW